jgi:membrane protease subunit HflC
MHLQLGHDHDHHDHDHHHAHGPPAHLGRTLCLLLVAALAVVLLVRSVFFVDETEYVAVNQFGRQIRLHTEAGLGFKMFYQSLRRFDRRLQMYEPPGREMLTEDKENLTFQWYVCWRIPGAEFVSQRLQSAGDAGAAGVSDQQVRAEIERYVRRFLQTVGTMDAAQRRLEERIQAAMAAEIGRTQLRQLVTLQPDASQLEAMATRVTASLRDVAAEQFGIEVVDVRLKRFNYPEAVKPSVYAEIRSERERVAIQYRAEGASQKSKIESLADLQREQLLAQAKRDAARIRGEGEAKAIEIFNAAHGKDPEFYELLKTLETYRVVLDDQTTVVLSADSPFLRLLTRGLPEISPASRRPTEDEIAQPRTAHDADRVAAPAPAQPAAAVDDQRVRPLSPAATLRETVP